MSKMDLYKGDCLTVMGELIAKGIVVDENYFNIATERIDGK